MRIIRIISFLASKIFNFFLLPVNSLQPQPQTSLTFSSSPKRRALYTFAFACKHLISLKFYKPVNTSFFNRSPSGEARIIPALTRLATPFFTYFLKRTFNNQTRTPNVQVGDFGYRSTPRRQRISLDQPTSNK